jgi:hypothetical protein
MGPFVTLYACYPGDNAAGIPAASWEIKDLFDASTGSAERAEIKKAFGNAFKLVLGESVEISFSDEINEFE